MATTAASTAASTAARFTNPFLAKDLVRQFPSSSKVGVVVSAGKMKKAVRVRIAGQEWNRDVRKDFPSSKKYIVHDPNSSLVEGDVIRMASGWRTSKSIRHVVTAIIAPFGKPINERPPIPTEEERLAERMKRRLAKDVRAAARGRQISELRVQAAREQGWEVPDLDMAMRNIKLHEEREAAKKGAQEAHRGQVGQITTGRERRRQEREMTKKERAAGERVKEAKERTIDTS